MYITGYIKVIT